MVLLWSCFAVWFWSGVVFARHCSGVVLFLGGVVFFVLGLLSSQVVL